MRQTSWKTRPSSLVSDKLQGKPLDALQTLANLLAEASQEWIKALGHATQDRALPRILSRRRIFWLPSTRLSALEHQADDAERDVAATAVKHAR